MPHLLKGSAHRERLDRCGRPLGAPAARPVAVISPFNFPAMVPMWFFPIAIAAGQHRRAQAVGEGAERGAVDGRAVARGGAARRRVHRRARRQDGRRRAADPSRRQVHQLRRVDADRPLHLRDGHRARQARAGARRREEPHGRAARRRPRPRRRPGRQRRVRVGGGAVHVDLRAGRGRLRRRRPGRDDRRAGPRAAHRRRPPRRATWGRWSRGPRRSGSPATSTPARREGATLVVDGRAGEFDADGDGFFVGPTLLDHVRHRHVRLHRRDLRPGAVACSAWTPTSRPSTWSTRTRTATAPRSSPTTAAPPAGSRTRWRSG